MLVLIIVGLTVSPAMARVRYNPAAPVAAKSDLAVAIGDTGDFVGDTAGTVGTAFGETVSATGGVLGDIVVGIGEVIGGTWEFLFGGGE